MRRRWIALAALVFAAAGLAPAQVQTKKSQAAMTPAQALERLKEGNGRFLAGKPRARDLHASVLATASGQYPFAAVVSCMDSRAPIELVLDQGIGDMFSLRSAGNVIDADVLGGLEYAAKVTGAKLIVVLGHTHCGAVKGAIDDVRLGNLTQLLARIRPAVRMAGPGSSSKDKAFVARIEEANVRLGMKEIRERSAVLDDLLNTGTIGLVGGMYDIETGNVVFFAD
ncbi:MAG: carbonic anhydrase family protein [Thermoanaerobaculia bacterium]